jgi:GntR family transcriptional regulator, transcriptional repressor for pyruvate dehydrogenase complex
MNSGAPLPTETEATQFVEPVRAVRTFETAMSNILEGIERARLRSGDRLPNETELASQLGISKPTLRQALRVLERSGLLVVKQGKTGGIFLNSDFVPPHGLTGADEIEERSALESLRARRLIETCVVEEALRIATEDDFGEIQRTIDLVLVAGTSMTKVMHADLMFHRSVARATHNAVLEPTLQVVYNRLAPVRSAYQETATDPASVELVVSIVHELHSQQLDALRKRDHERLLATLDVQFRYFEERFASSANRSWEELFGDLGPSPKHKTSRRKRRS